MLYKQIFNKIKLSQVTRKQSLSWFLSSNKYSFSHFSVYILKLKAYYTVLLILDELVPYSSKCSPLVLCWNLLEIKNFKYHTRSTESKSAF